MNTPYERWYLLKRKHARVAKQQALHSLNFSQPENSGRAGAII